MSALPSKSGALKTSPSLLTASPPPGLIARVDPAYARVKIVPGWKGHIKWVKINGKDLDDYKCQAVFDLFAVEKCNFSDVLYRKSRSVMTREE